MKLSDLIVAGFNQLVPKIKPSYGIWGMCGALDAMARNGVITGVQAAEARRYIYKVMDSQNGGAYVVNELREHFHPYYCSQRGFAHDYSNWCNWYIWLVYDLRKKGM